MKIDHLERIARSLNLIHRLGSSTALTDAEFRVLAGLVDGKHDDDISEMLDELEHAKMMLGMTRARLENDEKDFKEAMTRMEQLLELAKKEPEDDATAEAFEAVEATSADDEELREAEPDEAPKPTSGTGAKADNGK